MVLEGMETFADLHCSLATKHGHDHGTHIGYYTVIGVFSGFGALLSAWCILKTLFAYVKPADVEDKQHIKPMMLQLSFFTLTAVCCAMRIPTLRTLCAESESDEAWSMWLYVIYTTTYMLQWALMVLVLFGRLHCVYMKEAGLNMKRETLIVTTSLLISLVSWTANCVRLLTNNNALDQMNFFLGAVSISSLVGTSFYISLRLTRALYRFHLGYSYLDWKKQTAPNTIQLIAMATKVTIVASFSITSSVLMLVCVAIIGTLSHGTSDAMVFLLFIGHSVDVAGNCLGLFLALNIGAAQYQRLCGRIQSCFLSLCEKCVTRNHQHRLMREALLTVSVGASTGAEHTVDSAAVTASAKSKHFKKVSRQISANLGHHAMNLIPSTHSSTTQSSAQNSAAHGTAVVELPTMIATTANEMETADGPALELAEERTQRINAKGHAAKEFPFCDINPNLTVPI